MDFCTKLHILIVIDPNTGIYSGLGNYDYYEITRLDTVSGFYEFSYDTETWLGEDLSSQQDFDLITYQGQNSLTPSIIPRMQISLSFS